MLSKEIILIFGMPLSSPRLYESQWKVKTLIPEGGRSPGGVPGKGGLEDPNSSHGKLFAEPSPDHGGENTFQMTQGFSTSILKCTSKKGEKRLLRLTFQV